MNETAGTMSSSASTTAAIVGDKCYACSEVETNHVEFEWKIKDFRLFLQETGEYMNSPIFSAKKDVKIEWQLKFYPRGRNKEDSDYISVFLHLDSLAPDAAPEVKIHGELSVFKSESIKCTESVTGTYEPGTGYGYAQMMERSKLLGSCGSDDSFTIRCRFDLPQRIITKPVNPVPFDLNRGRMNQHYSQLFEDSRFCNVTILVGEEKFTAHKLVLAARSTVFAAMFEHKEMEENRKNEVKIEDMEPATVKGMLEFYYKDEVTDLETLARGLLRASDKYDLTRLRAMCEETLYKTLTTDNAAEILVLSDMYHSHKLKEYVIAFIDLNLLDVTQSESFKSMEETHPSVLGGLMRSIAIRRASKT